MLRRSTIAALVLLSSGSIFSQKVIKTISNEVCSCFKKEPSKSTEESGKIFEKCMVTSIIKNADAIKKEMKIDVMSGDEEAGRQLGEKVGVEMVKSCPEFLAYAMALNEESSTEEAPDSVAAAEILDESEFTVDKSKAKNIKTGQYKYIKMFVNGQKSPIEDESSYFEFKDNGTKYYDYSDNGKKVYTYSVIWKSETVAELKLLSKKNLEDDKIINVGDKVTFTIKNTGDGYFNVEHHHQRLNIKVVSEVAK